MDNKMIKFQIEKMIGKTFQYGGQIHYVKKGAIDETNNKFIIISNLSTYERPLENVKSFLNHWKPTENMAVLIENSGSSNVVTRFMEQENELGHQLIYELNENIANVRKDKAYIPQAQAITNSISAIINISKQRLDLIRIVLSAKH
jgi:hypothetical protein